MVVEEEVVVVVVVVVVVAVAVVVVEIVALVEIAAGVVVEVVAVEDLLLHGHIYCYFFFHRFGAMLHFFKCQCSTIFPLKTTQGQETHLFEFAFQTSKKPTLLTTKRSDSSLLGKHCPQRRKGEAFRQGNIMLIQNKHEY